MKFKTSKISSECKNLLEIFFILNNGGYDMRFYKSGNAFYFVLKNLFVMVFENGKIKTYTKNDFLRLVKK